MAAGDHLALPDRHLDPAAAAAYEDSHSEMFGRRVVDAAVGVLAELAGSGTAVEFAVGTGRLALPLLEAGIDVRGIDMSEPMVAALRKKPRGEHIRVAIGDMTNTQVCDDATLVYLVFNTIMNLRTQREQVDCFRNAASHHVDGDRVRTSSPAFRYVWPSELDLMAELAGMTLESRWADSDRSAFNGESESHVSVWRKT